MPPLATPPSLRDASLDTLTVQELAFAVFFAIAGAYLMYGLADCVLSLTRLMPFADGYLVTSLRLIESAAGEDGIIAPFEGDTAIFITPGYRFRAIDGLMTNFHLPRSTLFMLVSALMGLDTMQRAYAHAIANDYRFYSYGDASLLLP